MNKTGIDWTDETRNPIRRKGGGFYCRKKSPGCTHCYAEAIDQRFNGQDDSDRHYGGAIPEMEFVAKVVTCMPRMIKPRRHFISSMTDICDPTFVEKEWFFTILTSAYHAPMQVAQILTKCPETMLDWTTEWMMQMDVQEPPRHIHLGCSVENQEWLDKRAPFLHELKQLGWVTWYSAEPMLSAIDFHFDRFPVDLVIFGGESEQRVKINGEWVVLPARDCDWRWMRDGVKQTRQYNIRCFVKQLGDKSVGWEESGIPKPKVKGKGSGDANFLLYPEAIRIREMVEGFESYLRGKRNGKQH